MFRSAAIALALATSIALPTLAVSASPARAGLFDGWLKPPSAIGGPGDVTQAQSEVNAGDLVARLQRLEGQNRQLTGQVQELQNLLRRSLDQFKQYRDDTEFRLQSIEGGGKPPQKRSEARPPAISAEPNGGQPGLARPPQALGTLSDAGGQPRIDPQPGMMDAGSQDALPGDGEDAAAPDANAPMDLGQVANPATQPRKPSGLAPPGLPGVAVDPAQPPLPGTQTASLPQSSEDEYTTDYRLIETRNYEAAELAFRKFLQSYPNDKRAADAIHWIGESLYQRQQYRDAAEQFLKVTTSYGTYRRAPSSMLRLGMSLAALGEKEAACATLQEVTRKYPAAPPTVKSGVERETARNGC